MQGKKSDSGDDLKAVLKDLIPLIRFPTMYAAIVLCFLRVQISIDALVYCGRELDQIASSVATR